MILLVLMWKLAISRYRRYLQTPLEIITLVFLLFITFWFANQFNIFEQPKSLHYEIMDSEAFDLAEVNIPKQIVYYPKTNATEAIFDLVGSKLNMTKLEALPKGKKSVYYGTNDSEDVKNYLNELYPKTGAFVSFENMSNVLPSHLKYTIQMNNNFSIGTFYVNEDYTVHPELGVIYQPFMSLQWAIDTSYLQLRGGHPITQTLSFREFPVVESEKKYFNAILLATIFFTFNTLSLAMIFMFHVGRVVEDRISGVQALLSMSGVSSFLLNLSHFLNAFIIGLLYSILGIIFLCIKGSSHRAVIEHSSPFLAWLMYLMYFCTIILFGFIAAFSLPNKRMVTATALFVYIFSQILLTFAEIEKKQNPLVLLLVGLLPHAPFQWFWKLLFILEEEGGGITFSTLFNNVEALNIAPMRVYVMSFVQIILYAFLGWYLSLVRPGKFVTPMPYGFLCMKDYWKKRVTPDIEMAEVTEPLHQNNRYFEQEPPQSQIGIKIVDVSKAYNNNYVLKKLNLNVYKGEITVLLGHNGAGKTTILSIIAGMTKATSGTVYVDGLDIALNTKRVVKSIGVCPQENMFFNDLSVLQHIMFFTMLRTNEGFKKAGESSLQLLKQLDIEPKKHDRVTSLSGGMMRRVQLGCALAGDSSILILDEPTSGLDVETRRDLWDLLLSLRGERTVLLTTHFMEEADALGDRVAALHAGELRCHATPEFLKKQVGDGYLLTLITLGLPKTVEFTNIITSEIPDATLKESTLNSITFSLPPHTTANFPKMFFKLEENRDELGIEAMRVGTSTLEEVFLSLCSDVDVKFNKDSVDAAGQDVTYQKVTGPKLYYNQFLALLKRRLNYIIAEKYAFFFTEIILPIVILIIFTALSKAPQNKEIKAETLSADLSVFDWKPNVKVLLDIQDKNLSDVKEKFKAAYRNVEFKDVPDIANETLTISLENVNEYKRYLLGLQINTTHAQVLYSTAVRHTAPVAVNLLTNMLAGEPGTIVTYNKPTNPKNETAKRDLRKNIKKSEEKAFNYSVNIAIVVLSTLASCVTPLTRERATGTRHIFMMYGCSPVLYWMFTWLYHTLLYTAALIVPAIVIIVAFEGDESTFNESTFLGVLFLMLFTGFFAVLAFYYFLSMRYNETHYMIILTILIIAFGWFCPIALWFQKLIQRKNNVGYKILIFFDHVIPLFTFTNTVIDTSMIAIKNRNCEINRINVCNTKSQDKNLEDLLQCCNSTGNVQCYLCSDNDAVGKRLILLVVQAIFFMVLTILAQYGIFDALWGRIRNIAYKTKGAASEDPLVSEEINYVNNAMKQPPANVTDALLVQDLYKRYPNICGDTIEAVKGVSLSVKRGECFGLVGVNGAGKTSMFNMLVGASHITRGKVLCNGVYGTNITGKYLRELGYCPQHHSLDDFQSGDDNLSMLLKFRGYKPDDIKREVDYWIQIVALQQHRRKRMSSYSGGCKRRLAAAAALMCGGALTVLDEPTTGVDVAARRALWMALRAGLRGVRAVIVSSHSMEEIEALCGRVCVLVAGEVRALAAPATLRRRHAADHRLHVALSGDPTIATEENVNKLKADIEQTFECILKDSHRSMLNYSINRRMNYSDMFAAVEEIKARHPLLLLDYTVKEPTLEEVFLQFAREGRLKAESMRRLKKKSSQTVRRSSAAMV